MEKIINIHIKKLPDGIYLATSKDIQGLVAQGRTATEALEIARDVARKLIEAQAERSIKGTSVTFGHLLAALSIYHPRKLNAQYFHLNFCAVC